MFKLDHFIDFIHQSSNIVAHSESPYSFAVIGRHHWLKEKEGEALEISEQVPHPDVSFTGDAYDGDMMLLLLERTVADDVPIV